MAVGEVLDPERVPLLLVLRLDLGVFLAPPEATRRQHAADALLGGALLVAIGLWTVFQLRRAGGGELRQLTSNGRLLLTGLALSIDNLVVGFSLGVQHVSLVEAVVTFGVVTIALTLVGLEFGRRLGALVESMTEYLAAAVLILVGALLATGNL